MAKLNLQEGVKSKKRVIEDLLPPECKEAFEKLKTIYNYYSLKIPSLFIALHIRGGCLVPGT